MIPILWTKLDWSMMRNLSAPINSRIIFKNDLCDNVVEKIIKGTIGAPLNLLQTQRVQQMVTNKRIDVKLAREVGTTAKGAITSSQGILIQFKIYQPALMMLNFLIQ